jgi:hypothetical protein
MSDVPDPPAEASAEEDDPLDFVPVPLRFRHDGWTPRKQDDFIRALAETACVEEACARVKMSTASAYKLRSHFEGQSFRLAWDAALDVSVSRLSDAAISRAVYGVPVPHFYKGEQVGEHRRYDERLTMWLLRYRDPVRYGRFHDRMAFGQHPEGRPLILMRRLNELWEDCFGFLKRRFPVGPDYEDGPR